MATGPPKDWREFSAGFFSGQVNILATYPIHKTMFRQVVHHISVLEALKQLRREGLLVLYRGAVPPLIHKSITSSIMFGTYSQYSRILTEKTTLRNEVIVPRGLVNVQRPVSYRSKSEKVSLGPSRTYKDRKFH